jgi:endogenous inhibitor of DNA gyrase (YacG/DUF329 family)
MGVQIVECPACGREVPVLDAEERGQQDEDAPLSCPTCGAGFDRDGNLRHEPRIGP